jgi:hypothetical protein
VRGETRLAHERGERDAEERGTAAVAAHVHVHVLAPALALGRGHCVLVSLFIGVAATKRAAAAIPLALVLVLVLNLVLGTAKSRGGAWGLRCRWHRPLGERMCVGERVSQALRRSRHPPRASCCGRGQHHGPIARVLAGPLALRAHSPAAGSGAASGGSASGGPSACGGAGAGAAAGGCV